MLVSYGDHRIAMAFAVAALTAGDSEIAGAECVSVSFPDFSVVWNRSSKGNQLFQYDKIR